MASFRTFSLLALLGFASLPFASPSSAAPLRQIPSGSYQQSCSNISVSGTTLSATCTTTTGTQRSTQLQNFNQCTGDIANLDGALACNIGGQPPSGSYQQSCRFAYFVNGTLFAECKTVSGQWVSTQLPNVGQCVGDVANLDGTLACNIGGQPPAGSYQQSCRFAYVVNNTLYAECQNVSGQWVTTQLPNFTQCLGDVANFDGGLACNIGGQPPSGSYQQSCRFAYFINGTLHAECKTVSGQWVSTQLPNVGQCLGDVANLDGTLACNIGGQPPAGSYQQSCRFFYVVNNTLNAECETISGQWVPTQLQNINQCIAEIANADGNLVCDIGLHVRQDVANLTPAQIASIQKGFRVLIQRSQSDPHDPTGYSFQANIHSTTSGASSCTTGSSGQSLWDQCQHSSYFFFSWHRMYLYFFERILRAASGDMTLALPYWNYESASERSLPAPWREPDNSSNPLWVSGRAMGDENPACQPNPCQLGVSSTGVGSWDDSNAMMDTSFETSSSSSAFGGDPPTGSPNSCHFDSAPGDLELQPHNVIHCQVGGLMCDVFQSANDPIFWLHHAEIDHLWKVWLAQGGGRTDPTSDSVWLNQTFSFYNEFGQVVTLTGQQVVDTAASLEYRYDDDTSSHIFHPRIATSPLQLKLPPTPPEVLAVSPQSQIGLANEMVHVHIPMAESATTKLNRLLVDKKYRHVFVLNLEGIQRVQDASGLYYEILLDVPPGAKPPYPAWHHVANLGLFLPQHHAAESSQTVKFDLTSSIRALRENNAWNEKEFTISFVPVGITSGKNQTLLPAESATRLTIRSVSITAR